MQIHIKQLKWVQIITLFTEEFRFNTTRTRPTLRSKVRLEAAVRTSWSEWRTQWHSTSTDDLSISTVCRIKWLPHTLRLPVLYRTLNRYKAFHNTMFSTRTVRMFSQCKERFVPSLSTTNGTDPRMWYIHRPFHSICTNRWSTITRRSRRRPVLVVVILSSTVTRNHLRWTPVLILRRRTPTLITKVITTTDSRWWPRALPLPIVCQSISAKSAHVMPVLAKTIPNCHSSQIWLSRMVCNCLKLFTCVTYRTSVWLFCSASLARTGLARGLSQRQDWADSRELRGIHWLRPKWTLAELLSLK